MTSARIRKIVINSNDPERSAAFWSELLTVGVQSHGPDPSMVWLEPRDAGGVAMGFQRVEAPVAGSNTHLDIGVDDLDAAQALVEQLGGSIVKVNRLASGFEWRVVADVHDNRFCIFVDADAD